MHEQASRDAVIGPHGTIDLSERVLHDLGWAPGDHLAVEVLDGDQIVLTRSTEAVAARYAGAFTDLYPDPVDTRRFLDEGRGYADGEDALRQ